VPVGDLMVTHRHFATPRDEKAQREKAIYET
jgi:hypothetical protein